MVVTDLGSTKVSIWYDSFLGRERSKGIILWLNFSIAQHQITPHPADNTGLVQERLPAKDLTPRMDRGSQRRAFAALIHHAKEAFDDSTKDTALVAPISPSPPALIERWVVLYVRQA